jgi:shikimate kinase
MEWNSVVDMTDDEEMQPQDKFMGLSFRKKRRLKKREKQNIKAKRKKLYEKIKDHIVEERNNNVDYHFLEDVII